ncbi:MAG: hypothetical protein HON14_13250 [Rhodospirillaceae bacterium]|jgi:hypothetical protein|nr:hypothetical protein [Rhodospirillaceae bacterium]MBT4588120.1 hypothetical protein [Rhodospirillaceae bacterium]MBT4940094.1 hypothetical protein [Rhodospirillaceae bacterium]MBT5939341.1 hypothetical protein [Rhodospirillaceae bacterium]MBT7268465.1 hypothetical protein [Rhodospirillaceae bacterium]
MPDVVEIYLCKAGQKLEDGRMIMSNDIIDKEAAKADAVNRVKISPSLARIAYYAISSNGDFKPYYSYTNPNVDNAVPKTKPPPKLKKHKRKKKVAKKGFWAKLKKSLGF